MKNTMRLLYLDISGYGSSRKGRSDARSVAFTAPFYHAGVSFTPEEEGEDTWRGGVMDGEREGWFYF